MKGESEQGCKRACRAARRGALRLAEAQKSQRHASCLAPSLPTYSKPRRRLRGRPTDGMVLGLHLGLSRPSLSWPAGLGPVRPGAVWGLIPCARAGGSLPSRRYFLQLILLSNIWFAAQLPCPCPSSVKQLGYNCTTVGYS